MAKYEYNPDRLKHAQDLTSLIGDYTATVDSALRQLMASDTQIGEAAANAVARGGKRIRPAVALLACEAVSDDRSAAIPVAVAFELAHAASLVQDDIIDDSSTRRGAPTIHSKYGVASAILVSDVLLFKIFDILGGYGKTNISRKRLGMLLTYLGSAARQAAEGEFLEVALASKVSPTEEDYVNAAGLKTGSLFAAAAASGGVAGQARAQVVKDLYEYGYHLGISFQVVDDILDIVGESTSTGKPALKDLQNDANNIVIMHALANAPPHKRNLINSMMWKESYGIADLASLREVFDEVGSLGYAQELSARHASLARARLGKLKENGATQRLKELTQVLEVRRY